MLHLFNKVYLEFDSALDINYDRVVISEEFGVKMHIELDKVAGGELIRYAKTFEEVNSGFIQLLEDIVAHGNKTGKKIIIFCDREAYKSFLVKWFKLTLPALDFDSFKTIADFTIYNQRIISNTQLSSAYSLNLNFLWDDNSDVAEHWNNLAHPSEEEIQKVKEVCNSTSYEFLLSTYLSGDDSYKEELRSTMHMFLRRWFKEMFTDNRQMVLLNITNRTFQNALDIDPDMVDITRLDPLAGIASLEAYADDEIWERDQSRYGVCKLEGLEKEKLDLLKNTLLNVYSKYENMLIDRSIFDVLNWVDYASADTLTDEQMEEILDYFVNNPFDTIGIPRFDFQTVNFPLIQYFLSQKYNGKDLSNYRLL